MIGEVKTNHSFVSEVMFYLCGRDCIIKSKYSYTEKVKIANTLNLTLPTDINKTEHDWYIHNLT